MEADAPALRLRRGLPRLLSGRRLSAGPRILHGRKLGCHRDHQSSGRVVGEAASARLAKASRSLWRQGPQPQELGGRVVAAPKARRQPGALGAPSKKGAGCRDERPGGWMEPRQERNEAAVELTVTALISIVAVATGLWAFLVFLVPFGLWDVFTLRRARKEMLAQSDSPPEPF